MRLSNISIDKKIYNKQKKVTFVGFLVEFPCLIVELINAFFSNSLLVWASCLGSFETILHYLMVFISAKRIEKETGEYYNFGIERLETLVSLICNFLIAVGYSIIIATAVLQVLNPVAPADAIGYFLLIKVINIAFDIYYYLEKIKIEKKNSTRLNETEVANAFENLSGDALVGIIVSFCYFFRSEMWSWYISPVASIILALIFLFNCIKRIITSFAELSDKSFSISDQDKVFDIVLSHTDLIDKIISVNCRSMNNKKYVDLNVVFKDGVTYEQMLSLRLEVDKEIKSLFRNSTSRFVIESI